MALLLEVVVVFYETTAASQDETSLKLQVRPNLPPPAPPRRGWGRRRQIKICDVQAVELMWDLISLT